MQLGLLRIVFQVRGVNVAILMAKITKDTNCKSTEFNEMPGYIIQVYDNMQSSILH